MTERFVVVNAIGEMQWEGITCETGAAAKQSVPPGMIPVAVALDDDQAAIDQKVAFVLEP